MLSLTGAEQGHLWEPLSPAQPGQRKETRGSCAVPGHTQASSVSGCRDGAWESAFGQASQVILCTKGDPPFWGYFSHSAVSLWTAAFPRTPPLQHWAFAQGGCVVSTHRLWNKMEWLVFIPPLPGGVTLAMTLNSWLHLPLQWNEGW